jgi:hypothetical protein
MFTFACNNYASYLAEFTLNFNTVLFVFILIYIFKEIFKLTEIA